MNEIWRRYEGWMRYGKKIDEEKIIIKIKYYKWIKWRLWLRNDKNYRVLYGKYWLYMVIFYKLYYNMKSAK